jgi:hypothetical protein
MKLSISGLVVVLLSVLFPIVDPPAASAATITARTLLSRMTVNPESGGSSYDRTLFEHWTDANGDCQSTRHEVLIAESLVRPSYSSTGCTVTVGKWYSSYDGATLTRPSDVDIDHLVALAEAWGSGASRWSSSRRTAFANDLAFWPSLIAVTDNVNQAKSAKDPAEWLPPRAAARCTYAIQWIQVKYRWRLSVDATERHRLSSLLSGSCGSRIVVLPARGEPS